MCGVVDPSPDPVDDVLVLGRLDGSNDVVVGVDEVVSVLLVVVSPGLMSVVNGGLVLVIVSVLVVDVVAADVCSEKLGSG